MSDKLVVLDIECLCWEDNDPNAGVQETIQIGVCLLDTRSLKLDKRGSKYVLPSRGGRASSFCTDLTGIDQATIDNFGIPLDQAARWLEKEYRISQRTWASWGEFDRTQLQLDFARQKVECHMGKHLNLKEMAGFLLGEHRNLGVTKVLAMLGMEFEGRLHDGGDDAWNIARIGKRVAEMFRISY